jgi:hypothetical protein
MVQLWLQQHRYFVPIAKYSSRLYRLRNTGYCTDRSDNQCLWRPAMSTYRGHQDYTEFPNLFESWNLAFMTKTNLPYQGRQRSLYQGWQAGGEWKVKWCKVKERESLQAWQLPYVKWITGKSVSKKRVVLRGFPVFLCHGPTLPAGSQTAASAFSNFGFPVMYSPLGAARR